MACFQSLPLVSIFKNIKNILVLFSHINRIRNHLNPRKEKKEKKINFGSKNETQSNLIFTKPNQNQWLTTI
jgi:hypothetical protein